MGRYPGRARAHLRKGPATALAALAAIVILVAAASGLVACGGSDSSAPREPAATPMTLKVMEFNIEYGGDTV